MKQISRRRLLQKAGATTVAVTGMAGCLGQSGGSLDSVTVAYVPIYPNMQHYVMEQAGYYEDIPADITIERFSSGPSVVKAFASGDVDVALFGITPAMVLVDRGTNAGILAANSKNGFKIMATTELVARYEQEGAATFERFEQEYGRKVRFGVPPDGSVPDTVLRYWIEADLDIGRWTPSSPSRPSRQRRRSRRSSRATSTRRSFRNRSRRSSVRTRLRRTRLVRRDTGRPSGHGVVRKSAGDQRQRGRAVAGRTARCGD